MQFETTKIGDQWFLRSEEKDIAIDEILWISREHVAGRFEVNMKRGMACWATPTKPKQLHDWGKFTTISEYMSASCIHCSAKCPNSGECPGKPQPGPTKPNRPLSDQCANCGSMSFNGVLCRWCGCKEAAK